MIPNQAEPEKVIGLLWRADHAPRERPSPGPKPRLDVDRIVTAAIAEADEDPAGGVSMRAVARRLDVTPMTLYGYVPDKDTLVALMYDEVHAEMPGTAHTGDWRHQIERWAEDLVAVYLRHPWAVPVAYGRPVLGPHEQQVVENVAAILHEGGLEAGAARGMVGTILHLVRGTALAISAARRAVEESGVDEEDWWQAASARLSDVVPDFADRFPATVWLLTQPERGDGYTDDGYVAHQSMVNLRSGLALLFDGIESADD